MATEKDFEEFFALFNKHGVRYCILGAYAVAFHAQPRYTKDMDIWVEPSLDNAGRILKALKSFGFGKISISAEDLIQPDKIIQLGYEPVRIDLLTSVSGISFSKAWKHKERGKYGHQKVWYLGRNELIQSKTKTNRPIDRFDLLALRRQGSKEKN